MKMSLKIAVAVAVIAAVVVIWADIAEGYELHEGSWIGSLLVVEGVIGLLYFLFRKNIDAKFGD